jgi:hypothetical protein
MGSLADGLPSRFPVGTRYVVEGRGGGQGRFRIRLRYLEFPDGRHVELPIDLAYRGGRAPPARPSARQGSKIISGIGNRMEASALKR